MKAYNYVLETLLERERTAKRICAELNNFTDLNSVLQSIITNIKEVTKCETIGIRLKEGVDYPFYVYHGFPVDFILLENSLCKKDVEGNKVYCASRKEYVLDCMCGNVIQERYNKNFKFFSEKGSFWTNNSLELTYSQDDKEKLGAARGNCKRYGYKSKALIPIRSRGEIVGLLQISDKREGMLSKDLVEYLEMVCEHIGLAVVNSMMYEKLQEKLAQEESLIKEKEKLDELKTEFFANVSHELRTPLNIILGSLQLMKSLDNQNNTFQKYFNSIRQNCNRLLRQINNVIDITKLDAGYYELNLMNYDIVRITEDITLSVVEFAATKNINIIYDTDIEEKVMACDPDKIERIILNLLSNAIKFSDSGSEIYVIIEDKEENISISVRDTGRGIPKDRLGIIFDRFKQAHKSLSQKSEGSGIGLSLVKALVEMHDGNINVSSIVGKGTEFIIELPVKVIENKAEKIKEIASQSNIERIKVEFSDIYSLLD